MPLVHVILGPDSPQMSLIEQGLENAQAPYSRALSKQGERMRPEDQPDSYGFQPAGEQTMIFAPWMTFTPIDCQMPEVLSEKINKLSEYLDFHARIKPINSRPADEISMRENPGKYWEKSSIGQFWELAQKNDWDIQLDEKEARAVAAATTCPSAAYEGRCPGVSPEDAMNCRIRIEAQKRGISVEEIEKQIQETAEKLKDAPRLSIGGLEYIDAIGQELDFLPEAAMQQDAPVIRTFRAESDGPLMVELLNGSDADYGVFLVQLRYANKFEPQTGYVPPGSITNAIGTPTEGLAVGLVHEGKADPEELKNAIRKSVSEWRSWLYSMSYHDLGAALVNRATPEEMGALDESIIRARDAIGDNLAHYFAEEGNLEALEKLHNSKYADLLSSPNHFGSLPSDQGMNNSPECLAAIKYLVERIHPDDLVQKIRVAIQVMLSDPGAESLVTIFADPEQYYCPIERKAVDSDRRGYLLESWVYTGCGNIRQLKAAARQMLLGGDVEHVFTEDDRHKIAYELYDQAEYLTWDILYSVIQSTSIDTDEVPHLDKLHTDYQKGIDRVGKENRPPLYEFEGTNKEFAATLSGLRDVIRADIAKEDKSAGISKLAESYGLDTYLDEMIDRASLKNMAGICSPGLSAAVTAAEELRQEHPVPEVSTGASLA